MLDSSCHVYAYLDDIVVVAPNHLTAAAHDIAKRAMDETGLELNNTKTKAWARNPATPLPQNLPFERASKLKVLGCSVAWLGREESLAPVHS